MKDMRKDLAVTVVSDIAREPPARKIFPDRHECRILTIRHGAISLNKEGMACIKIDCIVCVLPALCKDDLCLEAVLVETKELSHLKRIADFLDRDYIGVEREGKDRFISFTELSQGKPRIA